MVLLERYLHAVHGHLPAKQADDIVAELGDDIRAQFDDRSKALGRPLTEDEEAALLAPYGRPLLLAARYKRHQYLIGPDVFPFYATTLKLGLAIALVVHAALVVGLAVAGKPLGEAARMLTNYPGAALMVFFWVTAAFALFDLALGRIKFNDKWDPRTLPRVTTRAPHTSRLEVGFELVIGSLFVLWWTSLLRMPALIFGPAETLLRLGPAWQRFYLPVLIVALASLVVKSVTLVRPDWTLFRFVSNQVMTAAGLVLMGLMLRAGDLVLPNASSPEAETLARLLNVMLQVSFVIAIMITVGSAVLGARRVASGTDAHEIRRSGHS
jgi:hypothetical protein